MAFFNEAWFHHAVDENVTQLAQQKATKIMGSVRMREGVSGKTFPFHRLGAVDMVPAVRDQDTTYANPPQSKRRAVLNDFQLAVLIDELDEVKMLPNPQSEFAQILANSRNRRLDDFMVSQLPTGIGGVLGQATEVNEAAETTNLATIPASQQIAAGGTGMTMTKVREAKLRLDNADVEEEDRYLFTSPEGMQDLLSDTTVTSSDFSTIKALVEGRLPMDFTWMGFHWRMSTRLPLVGNIRTCMAWQKLGVGLAVGLTKGVEINTAPHKWNNTQAIIKLSGGGVRIDDARVIQIDIDESV